jgi:pyruvate,water dikinase
MWVHALADATPSCGGKAVGLAKLLAAGLPVPPGFVIEDAAFRAIAGDLAAEDETTIGHRFAAKALELVETELPEELAREVERRAVALLGGSLEPGVELRRELVREDRGGSWQDVLDRAVFTIRSSATIEDGTAGAAAGVFSSPAVSADLMWTGIRVVWASALTPLAAAYARHRGASISIGVIVQRFVRGEKVTIYTRAPGEPRGERALIQRGEKILAVPRSSDDPLVALALRAEAAIDATDGADVELVVGDETWIVQARPIVHPVVKQRMPVPPALLGALVADGRVWTWDIGHNPDPLSPAQASLVERVDRAGGLSYAMRVCAGYLYSTPLGTAPTIDVPTTATALRERFGELEVRIANALGVMRRSTVQDDSAWAWHDTPAEAPPLDEAIERYIAACRIYGAELTPLVAAARARRAPPPRGARVRHVLAAARRDGARVSAVEAVLLAAARGDLDEDVAVARLGILAPAWDVAVPTYGERPALVRDAIERARQAARFASAPLGTAVSAGHGPAARGTDVSWAVSPPVSVAVEDPAEDDDDLASMAADLAERDDLWFARAQLLMRKAIQARADELGIPQDDAFWIPLDDLLAGAPLDPDDVRRRASAARAAAARAANWLMPRTVGGDERAEPATALRGIGTGPRVTGRIVRFATLASTVTVGSADVVVVRAVTPALAVQVIGCAAIVSESGGLLDHGAALSRELGITCVVGCHDAWSLLADGMVVTVDGDRGTVEIET